MTLAASDVSQETLPTRRVQLPRGAWADVVDPLTLVGDRLEQAGIFHVAAASGRSVAEAWGQAMALQANIVAACVPAWSLPDPLDAAGILAAPSDIVWALCDRLQPELALLAGQSAKTPATVIAAARTFARRQGRRR